MNKDHKTKENLLETVFNERSAFDNDNDYTLTAVVGDQKTGETTKVEYNKNTSQTLDERVLRLTWFNRHGFDHDNENSAYGKDYLNMIDVNLLASHFCDLNTYSTPPTLLAWCSRFDNEISVIDLQTKQNYVTFEGATISNTEYSSTLLKEIPDTKLLVSLHHHYERSANMEIFDISKKGKANKICSLGEVSGVVGFGDITYNSRRRILGAIPVTGGIAYNLFNVDPNAGSTKEIMKLGRKTKWPSQYNTEEDNCIPGFDFNPAGESIATIDCYGRCLISDVNTNNCVFYLQFGDDFDRIGRCRWSTNTDESLLFVKYDNFKLNILDVEKRVLTLHDPVPLGDNYWGNSNWIDVCQSNANLLVSGGEDTDINIFDKRESRIVNTFVGIHTSRINCVRWNPSGDMLASASADGTSKLLDFKTGKALNSGTTSDGSK